MSYFLIKSVRSPCPKSFCSLFPSIHPRPWFWLPVTPALMQYRQVHRSGCWAWSSMCRAGSSPTVTAPDFPIAASSPGSCPWSLCPVSCAQPLPPGPHWPVVPGTSLITICWSGVDGLQAVPGCRPCSPTLPPTTTGLHIIPLPTSLPHLSLTITCLEVLTRSR